jgi:hypothetical protein
VPSGQAWTTGRRTVGAGLVAPVAVPVVVQGLGRAAPRALRGVTVGSGMLVEGWCRGTNLTRLLLFPPPLLYLAPCVRTVRRL